MSAKKAKKEAPKSKPKEKRGPRLPKAQPAASTAPEPPEAPAGGTEAPEQGDGQEEHPAPKPPPPKRSGKRGLTLANAVHNTALDPAADFDTPTRKEPEAQQAHGSLLVTNPPKPTVANGRMKVFYDRPLFSKSKDRILIALQFSVPLGEEHDEILPKSVAEAHHDLLKRNRTKISLNGLPAQHATLYISADHKEELVTLPACKMNNVNIAMIQRKGEGSARKVARLAFRLQAEYSRPLATFGEMNLANDFWLVLKESQESLWDEEED
jgi:hypothetical protein